MAIPLLTSPSFFFFAVDRLPPHPLVHPYLLCLSLLLLRFDVLHNILEDLKSRGTWISKRALTIWLTAPKMRAVILPAIYDTTPLYDQLMLCTPLNPMIAVPPESAASQSPSDQTYITQSFDDERWPLGPPHAR